MDRTAELDHIHPKVKGGSNSAENLRWVCEQANKLKRAMTDSELLCICREVVAHLKA